MRLTSAAAAVHKRVKAGGIISDDLVQRWTALLDALVEVAPRTRAAIEPPVAFDDRLAASLPTPLSPELRRWFGLHNGVGGGWDGWVFPRQFPLGLAEAVASTLATKQIWDGIDFTRVHDPDQQVAGTTCIGWHPAYVYVAESRAGSGLFVDQRPGDLHGCVRPWDRVDSDYGEPVAPSLTDLISEVTRGVLTGEPVDGWVPSVVDGAIDWNPL